MNELDAVNLIVKLASEGNYIYKKHARIRMIERNLTDNDVLEILLDPNILRIDTDNEDGITSYKIEGGIHKHRLAIKFDEESMIIIITVMDRR